MPADLLLLETKKLSISGMRISEKNIAEALWDPLILINKEIEEQKKYLQFVESDKDYLQKREVFLHKLGGVKQGCRKTWDREECVELQHEFLELAKEYRYDKDIIKKLFSMQYHSYDSRSNYVGVSTYSYDYKHNVVNHLPDILSKIDMEKITRSGKTKTSL
jgi:hypothetical protein